MAEGSFKTLFSILKGVLDDDIYKTRQLFQKIDLSSSDLCYLQWIENNRYNRRKAKKILNCYLKKKVLPHVDLPDEC